MFTENTPYSNLLKIHHTPLESRHIERQKVRNSTKATVIREAHNNDIANTRRQWVLYCSAPILFLFIVNLWIAENVSTDGSSVWMTKQTNNKRGNKPECQRHFNNSQNDELGIMLPWCREVMKLSILMMTVSVFIFQNVAHHLSTNQPNGWHKTRWSKITKMTQCVVFFCYS